MRDVHWCETVFYRQIENSNIANQIHGFTIDYSKFILKLGRNTELARAVDVMMAAAKRRAYIQGGRGAEGWLTWHFWVFSWQKKKTLKTLRVETLSESRSLARFSQQWSALLKSVLKEANWTGNIFLTCFSRGRISNWSTLAAMWKENTRDLNVNPDIFT